MKFDKTLINVLTNISKINPGVVFEPGNVLMARHQRTPTPIIKFEFAKINFPKSFAIYNIAKLLSAYSMLEDPDIDISDAHLTLKDSGRKTVKIRFADKKAISYPDYNKVIDIEKHGVDYEFKLAAKDHIQLAKAVSSFGSEEIAFIGDGETISISTFDSKNAGVDQFAIAVGETDKKFKTVIDPDSIHLLNLDYRVRVSFKGLIEFFSSDEDLTVTNWITSSERSSVGK